VIDAYAHVGLPRFQSLSDYRSVMAGAGIARAVLCAFDSAPDLAALHDAITTEPDRFRAIGVPLGNGRAEVEAACRAQLVAGFSGLRLTAGDVTERPWLLDVLAERDGIALVVGAVASPGCAAPLVAYLDRNKRAAVVGGHFAGVATPNVLDDPAVALLFAHPRFFVQFSRQGAWPPGLVQAWSRAVLARTGWSRVMWGSEATVLFWRNETMADVAAWVDVLTPGAAERESFFEGAARRLYFTRSIQLAPLVLPFEAASRANPIPAVLWANGLPVDQALAGRLVHAWLADGGVGTLGGYATGLLNQAL